jgi:hypothetical protein
MTHPRLKSALETLLAFPDMPFQEISPPLAYYHSSRLEEHAKTFIELAADFVRTVHQQGNAEELRRRAAPFVHLTGPGSRYQELRDKAFKRLSAAFQQATPNGMAERLSVAELGGNSCFPDLFVAWPDVQKHLGDADSVLRYASETFRYCEGLIEPLSYPYLELIPLGYELREMRKQIEGTQLRGYFLLVTAYDTVYSMPQDAGRHRNLLETIVKSPTVMAAAKPAAEDLVAALPVDDGQVAAENSDAKSGSASTKVPCFITLFQAAAIVQRSKRTLEKYKKEMPAPSVPGGDGKAAYWDWETLRPWLEDKFGMKLGEYFPADRIPRHPA